MGRFGREKQPWTLQKDGNCSVELIGSRAWMPNRSHHAATHRCRFPATSRSAVRPGRPPMPQTPMHPTWPRRGCLWLSDATSWERQVRRVHRGHRRIPKSSSWISVGDRKGSRSKTEPRTRHRGMSAARRRPRLWCSSRVRALLAEYPEMPATVTAERVVRFDDVVQGERGPAAD